DDLAASAGDPAAGFLRGRVRLAVCEDALRNAAPSAAVDLFALDAAWAAPLEAPSPDIDRHGEPQQALQQYVRGLTGHLIEHSTSRAFADEARCLPPAGEKRRDSPLPSLAAADQKLLCNYAQHRLFGGPGLTAPAGMVAGWQLLFSVHVLAVWYAGLLMRTKRAARNRDAILSALWLLDQGLWRDEALVYDVLRHLNASEYTSIELAAGRGGE